MGFRVLYHLNTGNIKGITEEARWAESLGYDGLCTEETGHDPLFPLVLAATATERVTLEPRVAIAFPLGRRWSSPTPPWTFRNSPAAGSAWVWAPR